MIGFSSFLIAPHAGEGRLDFVFEAGDQVAVALDKALLRFDFGDDGALGVEGREGDSKLSNLLIIQCLP